MKVEIDGQGHGHDATVTIDGEAVGGIQSITYRISGSEPSTITIEVSNPEVHISDKATLNVVIAGNATSP